MWTRSYLLENFSSQVALQSNGATTYGVCSNKTVNKKNIYSYTHFYYNLNEKFVFVDKKKRQKN